MRHRKSGRSPGAENRFIPELKLREQVTTDFADSTGEKRRACASSPPLASPGSNPRRDDALETTYKNKLLLTRT